jgi:hypothetical protein
MVAVPRLIAPRFARARHHRAAARKNNDDADDAETAGYCVGGIELLLQRALNVLERPLGTHAYPERPFLLIQCQARPSVIAEPYPAVSASSAKSLF